MPAPASATYSVAALVAANTTFRDLIDAGGAGGFVRIRRADDVLLAELNLENPSGTIDAGTGRLTFAIFGPDENANENGKADYGEFCDSAGVVHLSMPTQEGGFAVSGFLVMSSTDVVKNASVTITSATVG